MSNRLLAEVEGWKAVIMSRDGVRLAGINPRTGKADFIPYYPNDLEACMRVAKIMEVAIEYDPAVRSHLHVCEVHYFQDCVLCMKAVEMDIEDSLSATLCPMLVEIAKERES